MKSHLTQRVDYIAQQLLAARMEMRMAERFAKGGPIEKVLSDVDTKLEKVARVLNGSEVPVGKRGAIDLDAPVSDPLDD